MDFWASKGTVIRALDCKVFQFDVVGKLLQTRMNSASVLDQNRIYTIGGLDNLNNEYFDLETKNSDSMKTMSTPQIFSQLIPLASTQC